MNSAALVNENFHKHTLDRFSILYDITPLVALVLVICYLQLNCILVYYRVLLNYHLFCYQKKWEDAASIL